MIKKAKPPSQLILAQPFSLVEVVQSGSCIQWKFHSHLFPLIGKQTDGQVLLFHYIFFCGLKCCQNLSTNNILIIYLQNYP